jgi:preprotein translocase subunit SecD
LRKNRFRIILTLIFIFLAVWFLKPTYDDYKYTQEASQLKTLEDSIAFETKYGNDVLEAKEKRLKLGLDLQGGMYVIMEVDIPKLLQNIAKKSDDVFIQALKEATDDVKQNDQDFVEVFEQKLRSKGTSIKAYYGEIRDDESKIISDLRTEVDNAIDRAVEVVRNRIDQYGVSEPVIQKKGSNRLVVELPGVSNVQDVKKLLQGTALLEFKLLIDPQIAFKVMEKINTFLAGGNLDSLIKADSLQNLTKKDTTKIDTSKVTKTTLKDTTSVSQKKDTTKKVVSKKDTSKKTDTNELLTEDTNIFKDTSQQQLSEEEYKLKNPWFYLVRGQQTQDGRLLWYVRESDKTRVQRILDRKDVQDLIPPDVKFAWSNKAEFVDKGEGIFQFYALKRDPELTGGVIVNARSNIDPTNNTPVVYMEMNDEGAADWARITGANINKQIAIVLDNVVYSAPNVKNKITGGNSQIEGMGSVREAKLLEIVLRAGALPAPLTIIEERTVGPSLGEDSIRQGVISSLSSLLIVALFMVVYYKVGGGVADLALLINVLFIMGIMASLQATLTMPGIAALILSLGMAVDTNVLIFERIREESATGKPLKTSIEIGYKKAFSAILDSHITNMITGIVLYQFGTGPIQGFAVTLLLGIAANLFTGIVITRIIIDKFTEKGKVISFG